MLRFTFFSFGSLVVFAFTITVALFLLTTKDRTRSSSYLGFAYLFLSQHALAFVIASSINHPMGAYHRLLILLVLPAFACMTHFFLHFPSTVNGKIVKAHFWFQSILIVGFSAYYIFKVLKAQAVFDFSEQSWTVLLPLENKILGLIILVQLALLLLIGLVRSLSLSSNKARAVSLLFVLFFLIQALIPGAANSLSRAGVITRATFLSLYTVFLVVGSFCVLMLYINTTRDRSTFMNRIMAITLGTFLLLTYLLGRSSIPTLEGAFDNLRVRETILAAKGTVEDPEIQYTHFKADETLNGYSEATVDWTDKMGNQRVFRKDISGNPAIVGYKYKHNGNTIEVGFPYSTYRLYVHDMMLRYIVIIVASVIIVLLGFRLFFHGTIWIPLRALLDGIQNVNQGDLSTSIPVRVKDEIGFLTQSFNGMVGSIRDAKQKLRDYADNLEQQVKERTAQLSELLEQQYGDYFLTSLLLEPLGKSSTRSRSVNVETLTKQKKEFVFRDKKSEIGGDLSFAANLKIGKSNCIFFINADAMGKSIQGAGGAIVLGAVLGAILTRSELYRSESSGVTPQRWIRSTFLELAKVFELFDGSMLVSVILGLIDEDSGITYLINAEHPAPVLYRHGKATLLEMKRIYRHLGLPVSNSEVNSVSTIRLKTGDTLIIGSDGKDDLVIGSSSNGVRQINENEKLFLEHVEKGKGDLTLVFEEIKRTGDISDDLSLLKIEYIGQPSANGRSESIKAHTSVET